MRLNLHRKHTTKSERIVYEVLKALHIPFRHRWYINGREVDFLTGNLVIEVDGHEQDSEKNNLLITLGYTPVHVHNSEATRDNITKILQTYNAY